MNKPPQESSRRRAGIRLGVAIQILLACVLLGAANYAGFHYYFRGDWSPTRKYQLGDQTRSVLAQLPSTVKVSVFFSPTTAAPGFEVYGDVVSLLKEYQFAARDKMTVEYIDPMRNLARARELQALHQFGPEENLVIVEMGGRSKQISAVDMADYDFLPQLNGEPPRVQAFKGEQALTSALIELAEPQQRTVISCRARANRPSPATTPPSRSSRNTSAARACASPRSASATPAPYRMTPPPCSWSGPATIPPRRP